MSSSEESSWEEEESIWGLCGFFVRGKSTASSASSSPPSNDEPKPINPQIENPRIRNTYQMLCVEGEVESEERYRRRRPSECAVVVARPASGRTREEDQVWKSSLSGVQKDQVWKFCYFGQVLSSKTRV